MRNGIILIDKPAGVTSAGVVARVKRILGASRVGHAGTLDPDATGLLVILVNGATRVASYAADGSKVYSGTFTFGIRTSTDDVFGEVLATSAEIPAFAEIERQSRGFVGEFDQVPPKVSAVKVGGKRAHKLQRGGLEFELEPRRVTVHSFEVKPGEPANTVQYRVSCSPGFYVRALARDLGEALGCGGAASAIRRERSGHLSVEGAATLEAVGWESLQDWSVLLPEVPRIELPVALAASIHNGQRSSLRDAARHPAIVPLLGTPGIFLYGAQGNPETMGILAISPDGQLQFELNLGLKAA